ncbi:MAG: TIR domain-containing protein [Bacteroidota bacterium]
MRLLISYSHFDKVFARVLNKALARYGFDIWMYEHHMNIGDDIGGRLQGAINSSDFVVVIITPNSVRSEWVNWEILYTKELEKIDGKIRIMPVLFAGDKIPRSIAGRAYADFRTDESMKNNFSRLVEQLLKAKPYFQVPGQNLNMNLISEEIFEDDKYTLIRAPIVGVVYLSPSWDEKKFVDVGSKVLKGDTLMLIEAMKLMNEIEAEIDGVIRKILVDDAQPVEFDEPLLFIG